MLPYVGIPTFHRLQDVVYKVSMHYFLPCFGLLQQGLFGFGQSADIDIVLRHQDTPRMAEIKTEDGKKERHHLYYDGETVSGMASILP